jgi:hypothetical protein
MGSGRIAGGVSMALRPHLFGAASGAFSSLEG